MSEQLDTPEPIISEKAKRERVQMAMAVHEATLEVLSESRVEILKRARAKLTAMGVSVEE
jgi:hypothetical protein